MVEFMNQDEKEMLWLEFSRRPTTELREKIIIEYAGLVKIVAGKLSIYLGHNVEYDDLVGYGTFGLIDAIDKFDYGKGVKFETYASLRIRGAILDQIRKMDWIPRTIRQRQKQIDQVMRQVESETGRAATDEEIALGLGISNEEYLEWQSKMKITNVVSLNEFLEQGSEVPNPTSGSRHFIMPEEAVEQEEIKKVLAEALLLLTQKERKVIELYYYEELTLKEISYVLEVTESRVSQLHTKALQKMKTKLGKYMGILDKV